MGVTKKRVKPGGFWQDVSMGLLVSSNLIAVGIAVYKTVMWLWDIDESRLGGVADFVSLLLPWAWGIDENTPDGVVFHGMFMLAGFFAYMGTMVFYLRRFDISPKAPERWKALCKKWGNEPARRRMWLGWGIVVFFVVSFVVLSYCLSRLKV
jgi:hypothetical protein